MDREKPHSFSGGVGSMRSADYYLENMPLAFCAIKVLTDVTGEPVDFEFLYSNKTHAEMIGYRQETIIGKHFKEVFPDAMENWPAYYYDTAFHEKTHILEEYCVEIDRHLLIYMFPLEKGCCGCVIEDVTMNRRMEQCLLEEQEKKGFLSGATTDILFEYDIQNRTLNFGDSIGVHESKRLIEHCPEGLMQKGLVKEKDMEIVSWAYEEIKKGKKGLCFDIQVCLGEKGEYSWYTVSCLEHAENSEGNMRIIGYLQNAEENIRKQSILQKNAMYDPLLNIYNVKTGQIMVEKALRSGAEGGVSIMFLIDLDDFKHVNDTYGHQKGDDVLKSFAQIVRSTFRRDDIVYRMGGDEIIGFLGNVTQPEQTVERIMSSLFDAMEKKSAECMGIRCSVGVFVSDKKHTYSLFYRMADRALYEAKNAGKNRYHVIRELQQEN